MYAVLVFVSPIKEEVTRFLVSKYADSIGYPFRIPVIEIALMSKTVIDMMQPITNIAKIVDCVPKTYLNNS